MDGQSKCTELASRGTRTLDQTTVSKICLYDDVINCFHDNFDLVSIGGTCEVGVDLFSFGLVEGLEKIFHKLASDIKVGTAYNLISFHNLKRVVGIPAYSGK